jgi:hypothetical protein
MFTFAHGTAITSSLIACRLLCAQPVENLSTLDHACAAISLSFAARTPDRNLPFSRCVELLPPTRSGTSMREIHGVAQAEGLNTVLADVPISAWDRVGGSLIVFIPPLMETRTVSGRTYQVGHFIVVRPVSEGFVQILDFPRQPPEIRSVHEIAASWVESGVTSLPAIVFDPSSRFVVSSTTIAQVPDTVSDRFARSTFSEIRDDIARCTFTLESGLQTLSSRIDFGTRHQSSLVPFEIDLVNSTETTLSIKHLTSDCGCVIAENAISQIAPSSLSTVRGSIFLRDRIGTVTQTVTFTVGGGASDIKLEAILHGESYVPWIRKPNAADFGIVPGNNDSAAVILESLDSVPAPFEPARVVLTKPWLSGEVFKDTSSDRKWIVRFTIDSTQAPKGPFWDTATMLSRNNERVNEVRVIGHVR